MRGEAVDAVERQVFVEVGKTQEAFEGGLSHVQDVGEAHVVFDQREDLLGLFVREVEAAKDMFGDADAYLDVAVEADTVVRIAWVRGSEGGGLADVVKEGSPGECGRGAGRKLFEEEQSVDLDVGFRVVLGRLLEDVKFDDLWADVR